MPDLGIPVAGCLEKFGERPQSLFGVVTRRLILFRLGDALAQQRHGWIDFAFFPFVEDDAEHFPNIFHAFEMIPSIIKNMDKFHDAPTLKFFEAVTDVGAGDVEGGGDFVGRTRAGRDIEQGMNLRDGAVDAPAGAHFSPVQDEFLFDPTQFIHTISNFCLNRNY